MNSEFSIELQAENIFNYKTKEYFHEVLSSYINGNYRSAIVMLWTVTVVDLVFKLQDLSNIYNDAIAKKILEDIETLQKSNPNSPQWEKDLIDRIEKDTGMFETHEIAIIKSLQIQRHLSAHPVIKNSLELYHPNKETVRAFIRNILETVLTKAPLASNKIFDVLIQDLAEKKDLFPKYEDLIKYLESAFLKNIPISVVCNIFKRLWKFVFKLDDTNCKDNRLINLRTLGVFVEKYEIDITNFILKHKDYFGQNISLENDKRIEYFVLFSAKYPKVYSVINEIYKNPISEKIKQNKKLHTQATFLYSNSLDYINELKENIGFEEIQKDENIINEVVKYCKDLDNYNKILEVFIEAFNLSNNYNTADIRFDRLIEPFLKDFNRDMLIELLIGIQNNYQQYSRSQASIDHPKIKNKCDEILGADFDYSQYNNFVRRIG